MFATQINFSDAIAQQIQTNIQGCGETFEQFIQKSVTHELQRRTTYNLQSFVETLLPLESFTDIDSIGYVDAIRSNSRIIHE